jgi:hypothetical protein
LQFYQFSDWIQKDIAACIHEGRNAASGLTGLLTSNKIQLKLGSIKFDKNKEQQSQQLPLSGLNIPRRATISKNLPKRNSFGLPMTGSFATGESKPSELSLSQRKFMDQ